MQGADAGLHGLRAAVPPGARPVQHVGDDVRDAPAGGSACQQASDSGAEKHFSR